MKSISKPRVVVRNDGEYEQVVFAEVLIPNTPNTFGDFWTEKAIFDASVEFMRKGFGIDVEHNNVDVRADGRVFPVASFIARKGDPDFVEGSWVVGVKITDPDLWQDVLANKINGFSYEAIVEFTEAVLQYEDDFTRTGVTEPDITDGHVHDYMVMVDENNRPIEGGTSITNGHSHEILTHTVTAEASGHTHRFNLITVPKG